MEEKPTLITTTLENLSVQSDKNQQMMMLFVETMAKERTATRERKTEPSVRNTSEGQGRRRNIRQGDQR